QGPKQQTYKIASHNLAGVRAVEHLVGIMENINTATCLHDAWTCMYKMISDKACLHHAICIDKNQCLTSSLANGLIKNDGFKKTVVGLPDMPDRIAAPLRVAGDLLNNIVTRSIIGNDQLKTAVGLFIKRSHEQEQNINVV